MKKYLFLFAALLAVAQMSAQTPDTVTVIDKPQQVIITETPNGSIVRVKGMKDNNEYNYTYRMEHAANDSIHTSQNMGSDNDWELNYPFKKSSNRKYHWTIESKGLYFGGGLHTSNTLVNNVYNWGFLQIASVNYDTFHGQHFSVGVGYDSKRFSLKRPNCFVQDEASGIVGIGVYPDNMEKRSSILNVRAIQFPLLFQQDITKDFHIILGASMNWNVYAKCNTHYKLKSTDHDITYHNIKQNKLTFDIIGSIGWEGLALIGRYSPCEMFKKGFGPEIKETWTLGVAIGL